MCRAKSILITALLLSFALANTALAGTPAQNLAKGDPEHGRKLLAEQNCNGSCHQSYADDNDPLSLYRRTNRKITSASQLLAQVERCVLRLGHASFPEDMVDMASALNADFYHF